MCKRTVRVGCPIKYTLSVSIKSLENVLAAACGRGKQAPTRLENPEDGSQDGDLMGVRLS